jgi:hypothetical protein
MHDPQNREALETSTTFLKKEAHRFGVSRRSQHSATCLTRGCGACLRQKLSGDGLIELKSDEEPWTMTHDLFHARGA